jgi:hypothetical protein
MMHSNGKRKKEGGKRQNWERKLWSAVTTSSMNERGKENILKLLCVKKVRLAFGTSEPITH